jgi:hypothetical protein
MSKVIVTTPAYLIIEAERDINGGILRARIMRSRQSTPDRLDADQVVVRVAVALPSAVFEPLATVVITIPEDRVVRGPVEVEALEVQGEQVTP